MFRRVAHFCLLVIFTGSLVAQEKEQPKEPKAEITKATFLLNGLHCPPCTRTVEASLVRTKGVKSAKVDWATKNAKIEFDESQISAQEIAALITSTPHMMGRGMIYDGWLALKVPDIKDDATAKPVIEAIQKIDGVGKAVAYPVQKAVGVHFKAGGKMTTQSLLAELEKAGVQAERF